MHCGYCREAGHNRGGCAKFKAAIIRENELTQEEEHAEPDVAAQEFALHDDHNAAAHAEPNADVRPHGKGLAGQDDPGQKTSSRGRKRKQSAKMKEHVEQLMEIARRKKSKQVLDENGDIDFPVIRTHIQQVPVREHLDPGHEKNSMIHILGHEEQTHGIPFILEEIPEESHFVAENRGTIPLGRGPLVNTSGRALGSTTARGGTRARGATGPTRARGATGPTTARGATRARGGTRARASTAGTRPRRARGAAWLLFGDGDESSGQKGPSHAQDEFQSTQGAPEDDE